MLRPIGQSGPAMDGVSFYVSLSVGQLTSSVVVNPVTVGTRIAGDLTDEPVRIARTLMER